MPSQYIFCIIKLDLKGTFLATFIIFTNFNQNKGPFVVVVVDFLDELFSFLFAKSRKSVIYLDQWFYFRFRFRLDSNRISPCEWKAHCFRLDHHQRSETLIGFPKLIYSFIFSFCDHFRMFSLISFIINFSINFKN